MILNLEKPQVNPQEREFEELIYNPQGLLLRRSDVTFKQELTKNKLTNIKASKNKRFIALEVTRDPHQFGMTDLKTLEYSFFKAEGSTYQMHKSKVVLNLDKASAHDFDLSDEVTSLEFPYMYVLSGNLIKIVSVVTSNSSTFDNSFRLSRQGNRFLVSTNGTNQKGQITKIRQTYHGSLPRSLP